MSVLPPVVATFLADGKQYSAEVAKMQGQTEAFGRTSETTGQKLSNFANKASSIIIGAGVGIAAAATDLAYKYDEALSQMQQATHLTGAQMDVLKGQILTVSTATATNATVITTGMAQLIKSGESSKQALHDVGQAAKFAKATGSDLNTTLTAAIGIQRLHIAGTHNMTQTLNIFDTAVKNSQLTSDNLTTALSGKALSAFAAYHVDLKSAITVLAGFADQNLVGTKATMVLKTGIAALEKPTVSSTGKISASALALAKVGLNANTIADEVRKPGGILQVMTQLSGAFDKNATAAQKAQGIGAFMQQIFGTSAGPAFTNMISELPKLEKLYGTLNHTGGATNSAFATWLKTPKGAIDNFVTTLENALIPIGNVILPKLTDVAKWAEGAVKYFESHPLVKKIASDSAIGLFGAAVAYKIGKGLVGVVKGISGLFGPGETAAQTTALMTPLDIIATNTGILVELGGGRAAATAVAGGTLAGGGEAASTGILSRFSTALGKFGIGADALAAAAPALVVLGGQKGASAQDVTSKVNAMFYNARFSGVKFDATSLDIPGFPGSRLPSKPKGKTTVTVKASVKMH